MKLLRKILFTLLGNKGYLKLVSGTYITITQLGLNKKGYPELHYLKTLVKPGDVCLDIGANVGYYSTMLSKLTGKSGSVLAVEPVPLFAEVFRKNTRGMDNITLHNCALGGENTTITMTTPVVDGVWRHGLTKVQENGETSEGESYKAEMRIPDQLFSTLTRLDYVKCDVEGYEVQLLPFLTETLMKFKPLIQIEITPKENREFILKFLGWQGYEPYALQNGNLVKLSEYEALEYQGGDFYFKA